MTKETVRRFTEGNDRAFTELFRTTCSEVFWAAYRILGDKAAAEDIVQETFLRLHRMRSRVDPGRPIRPLLLKIASNCAIDLLRRGRREDDFDEEVSISVEAGQSEPMTGDGFSGELLSREIAKLPPSYRTALVLRYAHDLSYKELASALEVSVGAVALRLKRAKEMLRKRILEAGR